MANEILTKSGTPLVWADVTDYAGDGGSRTHQIDLTGLADAAARQGAKADLGATRAKRFGVILCAEMAIAPVAGEVIGLYWAASPHATAGTMNPGGASGADAAYTGTTGGSLDESLPQLQQIGNLILTPDADPVLQIQNFTLFPLHRYGFPIVDNNGGQAFHGDAIEMFVALYPLIDEVQ